MSSLRDTHYIDRKVDINSYMIFSPVFFANIGISASFDGFTEMCIRDSYDRAQADHGQKRG